MTAEGVASRTAQKVSDAGLSNQALYTSGGVRVKVAASLPPTQVIYCNMWVRVILLVNQSVVLRNHVHSAT